MGLYCARRQEFVLRKVILSVNGSLGSHYVKDVDIVCMPRRFDPFNLIFRSSKVTLDAQRDGVP